jgi:hypothetical protein
MMSFFVLERCVKMDVQRRMKQLRDEYSATLVRTRQLEIAMRALEESCPHVYIRERDDDYHTTFWAYTCQHCGHYTRQRPATFA